MKLSEQRILFTTLIADLIKWANQQGYKVALDQVKRTQAEANANAASGAGIKNSLHLQGLAADILLYDQALNYISDPVPYTAMGKQWKSMHELNRWGGDFKKVDANHFSSTRDGIQ